VAVHTHVAIHDSDGRDVRAAGAGVYVDHAWFAKLYVDPYASFGVTLQVRLSLGRKF
jgi:hypothetical protein